MLQVVFSSLSRTERSYGMWFSSYVVFINIDAPCVKSSSSGLELIRAFETKRKTERNVDKGWILEPNASKKER
jgi:hypothetical protein